MRYLVPLVGVAALAACVPAARPPVATPRPAPTPVVALPEPAPLASDWRDWPVTPGTWTYARDGGGTVARFGQPGVVPVLSLRCIPAARRIYLIRPGTAASSATIRTTSTTRAVALQPSGQPDGQITATFVATDPLLDAVAFSRGHFTVEQAGQPPLVIPAWAEIGRVIEDCRG